MYTFLMLFPNFLDSCIFVQPFETMQNWENISNVTRRLEDENTLKSNETDISLKQLKLYVYTFEIIFS